MGTETETKTTTDRTKAHASRATNNVARGSPRGETTQRDVFQLPGVDDVDVDFCDQRAPPDRKVWTTVRPGWLAHRPGCESAGQGAAPLWRCCQSAQPSTRCERNSGEVSCQCARTYRSRFDERLTSGLAEAR